MKHIVGTCTFTKFEGGLRSVIHDVEDNALNWLKGTATITLAK